MPSVLLSFILRARAPIKGRANGQAVPSLRFAGINELLMYRDSHTRKEVEKIVGVPINLLFIENSVLDSFAQSPGSGSGSGS